ncbi:hypothetical protein GCM10011349_13340 [Novosphingobium indicum]|uniref:Uncharacterized protein n=1 Tax=Novosphingobium indicum TaxID=462949 RepID=A0ABQ2JF55_9SPHN|nr:hypothetical protein GCM10011349_13340 [Novosphingobium indicum]
MNEAARLGGIAGEANRNLADPKGSEHIELAGCKEETVRFFRFYVECPDVRTVASAAAHSREPRCHRVGGGRCYAHGFNGRAQ